MGDKADDRVLEKFPRPSSLGAHYASFVGRLSTLPASRRSVLLGLARSTAGIPLVGALGRAASHFSVVHSEGRLSILIGANEAWRVDTAWFDGVPRLQVKHTDGFLRVQLVDANFPGTNLSAAFTLIVKRAGALWTARLGFPGLGFAAEFPFAHWLLGFERANASVALPLLAFHKAPDLRLNTLNGRASFGPDWMFDWPALDGAQLRMGAQRAALVSLRLELSDMQDAALPRQFNIWDPKNR